MKSVTTNIRNIGISALALAFGLILTLMLGDIINNRLLAGYRDRDFLSYIQFLISFIIPLTMWIIIFLATIPLSKPVRKDILISAGIGFGVSIILLELLAVFVFLVRYV